MNEENSGGMPCSVLFAIVILAMAITAAAMGGALPDRSSTRTTTNRTDVRVLSDNEIRILSPDTYIYYNSGDTSQTITGDRNNVAPVQTGGGQCWVSSSQSWGNCPAGVPAGAAVP